MDKKKRQKKHFSFKELRLSIAHMVLWALLSVAFFTYLTIEIGEKIERSPFYFIIVLTGYAIIVIVLTLVFSHRFLGPFERLKTELRIILSGNLEIGFGDGTKKIFGPGDARLVEDTTGKGHTTAVHGGEPCVIATVPLEDNNAPIGPVG